MFKKLQKIFVVTVITLIIMITVCFASEDTAEIVSEENVVTEENSSANENETSSEGETSNGDTTVGTSETTSQELYEDDLYQFDDEIILDKLVDGNAYLMGSKISVSGKVGGDLFVFADTLNLTSDSYIYGNLFVCANTITIDGIVCDLYSLGNLTISDTGIVLRDMRASGSNITVNGSVGRNAHITASEVAVGETALVYGDFNYSSNDAIQIPSGSVEGSINYKEPVNTNSNSQNILGYVINFVYTLVYVLVVFAFIVLLAPNFNQKLKDIVAKKSIISFVVGIILLVLPIPISALLILTIIGIPVAFAILSIWLFLILALSFAITTIAIANLIGSKVAILGKAHNLPAVILTTLVLWALLQIPFYVGIIVKLLTVIFGLGYLFVAAFVNRKKTEE